MDPASLSLFALYACGALLLAGIVKGAVGLGLPTTSLGLMTLTLGPRTAIALVLVPMFVSNIWQLHRAGEARRTARRYAPFVLALLIAISVTLTLSASASDRLLLAVLGFLMLSYVATTVTGWAPHVPDRLDHPAQWVAGGISGIFGGLAGIWAPPMAIYLASRGTKKDEFVRASGLILCLGSLPLIIGYIRSGFLPMPLLGASVLLLIPTFAGFAIGERLRGKMSEAAFRRALMVFFALVGLNLLRRAFL